MARTEIIIITSFKFLITLKIDTNITEDTLND